MYDQVNPYLHFPLAFYTPFFETPGYFIPSLSCCTVDVVMLLVGVVRDQSSVGVDIAVDPLSVLNRTVIPVP